MLAFLVMLGTSGNAFSAVLCAAGACGDGCASAIQTQAKSCCASKTQGTTAEIAPADNGCCCEITAGLAVARPEIKIADVKPQTVILPTAPAEFHVQTTVVTSTDVVYPPVIQPPIVARPPDLGRAPPRA